jgi:hypothetical protein
MHQVRGLEITVIFTHIFDFYYRLRDHVGDCTACPGKTMSPIDSKRASSALFTTSTDLTVDGVHCGEDTGLGSV